MQYLELSHIAVHSLSETPDVDTDNIDDMLDAIRPILMQYGFTLDDVNTVQLALDKYAIATCVDCEQLMIDRDTNPAGLPEHKMYIATHQHTVVNGGRFDNEELCESCLPIDHRWAIDSG